MTLHPDLTNALAAVQGSPDDTAGWKRLGLMIAAHGTPAHLQQSFGYRQAQHGDAAALLFSALFDQELHHNEALRDRIVTFADHCPEDETGTVMRFFSGCIQLCHGDPDAGVETFARAAACIEANPAPFQSIQHLIKAPAFATMMLTPTEVENRWSAEPALTVPTAVSVEGAVPEPAGRWVCASCDSKYFDAFAGPFGEAAGVLGPVHIHVVNPTESQLALMAQQTAPNRQFSHETQTRFLTSPYYAANRFFHLGWLMDRYGSDILMLDIDVAAFHEIADVVTAMQKGDLGYFAMPTVIPWLRHAVPFLYLRHTEPVRLLAERFDRLLRSMLEGSTWFVDQMGFLNLLNAYRQIEDKPEIIGLEAADGFPFAAYITPSGDDDTKAWMRTEAGFSA